MPAPPVPPSSSGEEAEACQVVGLPPPKVLGRTDPGPEFEDLWGLAAVATLVAAAPAPGNVVVVAVFVAVAAPPSRLCSLEPGLLTGGRFRCGPGLGTLVISAASQAVH